MKKIILKIILFFLILFLILLIISRIFVPKNNIEEVGMEENGLTQLYGEKKDSIDLIIYGNSESFTSIIPMKLWEDCGYTSCIGGYPGIALPDTIKAIYNVSKNQTPKIIVLEANTIYDKVPLTVPFARIIQTILPITEYHDRWKILKLADFYDKAEYKSTDYMKGFHFRKDIIPADSSNYMEYTDTVEPIILRNQIYLKIINEYCKKVDCKFIIICNPSTTNWNYARHNAVKDFTEKEKIDFLDFNLITNELGIDWNYDTLDGGDHMNYYGSVKLTNYFEGYLKNLNILENHKDDEKFSSWNEDLIKYNQDIQM